MTVKPESKEKNQICKCIRLLINIRKGVVIKKNNVL